MGILYTLNPKPDVSMHYTHLAIHARVDTCPVHDDEKCILKESDGKLNSRSRRCSVNSYMQPGRLISTYGLVKRHTN
jgi:hypothetical protein